MINRFKKNDLNQVVEILCNSFNMSEYECFKMLDMINPTANLFLLKNKCEVVCVASAIPVNINDKKGRYIYAVATKEDKRMNGYATKLLKYLIEYFKDTDVVLLKPAEDNLFGFYKKIGFDTELNADICDYYPQNDGCVITKRDVNEYIDLRNKFNNFHYSDEIVRYYFECYKYFCVCGEGALALYRIEENVCYIDEIYGENQTKLIQGIIQTENVKKAIVTEVGNKPYALAHFYNKQFDIQFRIPME